MKSLAEIVWPKVVKHEGRCWEWTGAKTTHGYGQIRLRGKFMAATRAVWILVTGTTPATSLFLCHHCDNPGCVNPDHLFVGTQRDNMRDAAEKGRVVLPAPRLGVANNKAKANPEVVLAMRLAYASGATVSALSRQHGLARSTVREIVNGRNWRARDVKRCPRGAPTHLKLDRSMWERMRQMAESGMPQEGIASALGVKQPYVSRWLHKPFPATARSIE